eukprot:1088041-Pelagomonas_calceolata.AAC.1
MFGSGASTCPPDPHSILFIFCSFVVEGTHGSSEPMCLLQVLSNVPLIDVGKVESAVWQDDGTSCGCAVDAWGQCGEECRPMRVFGGLSAP